MLVLGFTGGFDLIDETRYVSECWHDAAAVLVEDGKVLFAIEEERLNRIKHTDKLPVQAIRACLASRNVRLNDLDMICYNWQDLDWLCRLHFLEDSREPLVNMKAATFLRERFRHGLGEDIHPDKFRFIHHHLAHAMSAFAFSGYDSSLAITLDGEGDSCSGVVLRMTGGESKRLETLSVPKSLGYFYLNVIHYLGYTLFDEYKVMGLAPYGDPERFRSVLRTFYALLPNGEYEVKGERAIQALFKVITPRRKGEPFSQEHKDLAAALQESLEEIAFHILRHHQQVTQEKNLCLAGGVAHNCTLNGKILRSGMFDNVFIQPAAHDAGCALGAALYSYYEAAPEAQLPGRLPHVYWGTDIGGDHFIRERLEKWGDLLEVSKEENIAERAAELLASDRVIGWVQGRSEFGPRALGNRSILADPRPERNKGRINQLVKKREAYRPFAPSVIEEAAERFFDVKTDREQLDFMVFVVEVKRDKRELLGAVTHIDGTARIQTVNKTTNEVFWNLIHAFGERTGVPVLLNTSFNNNVEPIVDSVEDAIACFLTTGLDFLVVGDFLIKKKAATWKDYLFLRISLPPYISLRHTRRVSPSGALADDFHIDVSSDTLHGHTISSDTYQALSYANSGLTLAAILDRIAVDESDSFSPLHLSDKQKDSVSDLIELWSQRLIDLRP